MGKTLKDFLIKGGVKGRKFRDTDGESYEVLDIESDSGQYTICHIRYDSEPNEQSPQNLAWLLDDPLYVGGKNKMAATLDDIRGWLENGRNQKDITHLIVVCDTFDYDDYPVYVSSQESVREIFNQYHDQNMQKVMEVYSFRRDLDSQLNQHRAFCFD